jgi:serine protease Do
MIRIIPARRWRVVSRELLRPILFVLASIVLQSSLCAQIEEARKWYPRSLMTVFQEVIKEPVKSTVKIYCDGYQAALGAVVRSDGHIVTKASELRGKIECQLWDESRKHLARVVAQDSATDLAVLKIDAANLSVAPWASNEAPLVGSWLVTTTLEKGPLAIGVVSVAARRLPPNGALGIQLASDDDLARITDVREGLAAEKAGLKNGDIIRKVDDEVIKSSEQLRKTIRWHYPGDKVKLAIERSGRLLTIEATLGSLTDVLPRDERSEFQNSLGSEGLSERRTGFPMAIQHDTLLKPKECGGPIVDLNGRIVGLNIARAGRVESYALPAATVRDTVDRLLRTELTSTTVGENAAPAKPTSHER